MPRPAGSGGVSGGGLPNPTGAGGGGFSPTGSGRIHFDVDPVELDRLEEAAQAELSGFIDEWRSLIAANERLSELAEGISEARERLRWIDIARKELASENSADPPANPAEA